MPNWIEWAMRNWGRVVEAVIEFINKGFHSDCEFGVRAEFECLRPALVYAVRMWYPDKHSLNLQRLVRNRRGSHVFVNSSRCNVNIVAPMRNSQKSVVPWLSVTLTRIHVERSLLSASLGAYSDPSHVLTSVSVLKQLEGQRGSVSYVFMEFWNVGAVRARIDKGKG